MATTKATDEFLKRPFYIYDLTQNVLDSITVKDAPELEEVAPEVRQATTFQPDGSVGSQSCSLCSQSFETVQDQKGHLKSDVHSYNLKQKVRGLPIVTETEFEKLVETLDESLSGSDSSENEDEESKETILSALLKKQGNLSSHAKPEDDEELTKSSRQKQNSPMIWFSSPLLPENTYFSIYRSIFSPSDLSDPTAIPFVLRLKQLDPIPPPKPTKDGSPILNFKGPHMFMCMIGGGHFAAMVVALPPKQSKHGATGPLNKEAIILAHKTFHRYTTRRKQGGSQSANDNAKGAAHSAGSTLRRYNEQALADDVKALLAEWKPLLDTAELLFIRATGMTNRRTLFGPYEGQVLHGNDPRIRGFPFNTKRATQNELMRAFIELTRFKVREIVPVVEEKIENLIKQAVPKVPAVPEFNEEEETKILHTQQIQVSIKRSKLSALFTYLQKNKLDANFRFFPEDQHHHAPTPLHFAAAQNSPPIVIGLLVKAKADPTLKNPDGKTPYKLSGDRATRDAFRVARSELGEAAWPWDTIGIPSPVTRAEVEERAKKEKAETARVEAERKRREEERVKKETPVVKVKGKTKDGVLGLDGGITAQERREREARGLTPEMRMKLERERRVRAVEARMKAMKGGK